VYALDARAALLGFNFGTSSPGTASLAAQAKASIGVLASRQISSRQGGGTTGKRGGQHRPFPLSEEVPAETQCAHNTVGIGPILQVRAPTPREPVEGIATAGFLRYDSTNPDVGGCAHRPRWQCLHLYRGDCGEVLYGGGRSGAHMNGGWNTKRLFLWPLTSNMRPEKVRTTECCRQAAGRAGRARHASL